MKVPVLTTQSLLTEPKEHSKKKNLSHLPVFGHNKESNILPLKQNGSNCIHWLFFCVCV